MEDYYQVLGVPPDVSQEDLKERFRFLSHAYHPDKFATPTHKKHAEETFKKINEAYQILSTPVRRAQYDRHRSSSDARDQGELRRREETANAHRRVKEERRQREEAEAARRRAEEEQQQREQAEAERRYFAEERRKREAVETVQRRKEKKSLRLASSLSVSGAFCMLLAWNVCLDGNYGPATVVAGMGMALISLGILIRKVG
ncbi:MAG: J domain-containing protein [Deltaproteobacteria bacterium]|nr:J domain-containing protein [Deltaproteobacteria bacterium]